MLLPTSCPVCGARGPAPCPSCVAALAPAPALRPPPGVDSCAAVFAYSGVGRELVARLKYRNARASVPYLARAMAAAVERAGVEVEVVTWAPTSAARRRRRGFDQARLLARAVARRLQLPCRPLLRRLHGPAQTGRTRAERRRGPAFVPRGRVPPRALLVDDVVTSGGTVAAAARALRRGGATAVHVVVAARTPSPGAPEADVHFGSQDRQEGSRWTSPSSVATPTSPSPSGPRLARR